MKILHFLWGLDKGGAENLVVDLANQQSRDHEVTLLIGNDCVDPALRERLDPLVRFVHVGRPTGSRNPYWVVRLLWTIHSLRPDVIHSHARDLALLGRFIFRPMVLTVHDMNPASSELLSRYDRICCISEAVSTDVHLRNPALNPQRIDNGIVTSRIATASNRVPPPVLRGVQVSRLVHETKGQDLLVRALAEVNAMGHSSTLTIDFIGEGPSLGYLCQLADELEVREHCNFLGPLNREDVYARLCDYDMLIQPSRSEGFGLTVVEAMTAGIPVVVSDIEGPMEVIKNGQYGYHFRSGNSTALAAALKTVISDIGADESATRLAAARKYVIDNYDLARTSNKYLQVYLEAIDAR